MSRPAQLPLPLPAAASISREDFVEGQANRLALAAVDSWPHWPHPILFLAGPAGSGKSHLAAAWRQASGARPFEAGAIDPARGPFAVVVEDLDREPYGEGDLFALLNAARLGGGHVLVTARRRPADLPLETPDLRSRLTASTLVTLGAPDEDLLAAVLVKLFADRQIEFDPRLLAPILARMERSLDAARRLVERIDRETLASGRRPTRRLVLDLLAADAQKGDGAS